MAAIRSFPELRRIDRLRVDLMQERFPAKWKPVRVKKTRQIENLESRSDFIGTGMALSRES